MTNARTERPVPSAVRRGKRLGCSQTWQAAVLAGAAVALLLPRWRIVETLLAAGVVGVILALAGAPVS